MSAPDPNAPSLLRRKGCWLTFLTGIPVLIGLAWFIEDQAGHRYLAKTKARLAAEGQMLDPDKILPVRPPDEENFCAVPLLVEIGRGNPTSSDFAALKQIAGWESLLRDKGGKRYTSQENPAPTDWNEVWRLIAKHDPKAGLPPMPDAAIRELGAAIESKGGKSFSQLEAALERPHAIMLPTAREDLAKWETGQALVWFNELRDCSRILGLRGRVALAAGDSDRGARTLRVMLRLADGADAHGSLVAALVGISIRSLACVGAWTGLRDKVFRRDDLSDLQKALSSYDGQASMLFVFQSEAIVSEGMWKQVRATPESILPLAGYTARKWHHWAFQTIPGGWFDYNEGTLLAQHADWRTHLGNERDPHRFARDSWPGFKQLNPSLLRHDWMASTMLSAYRSTPSSFATTLAVMHLAETACSLEAYFIDHQSYPASLDVLVPAFLSAVPMDLDHRPIRYAQDAGNRRYKLWSVGVNGTDEGGLEKSESGKPRGWREPVGDWVWRYP